MKTGRSLYKIKSVYIDYGAMNQDTKHFVSFRYFYLFEQTMERAFWNNLRWIK